MTIDRSANAASSRRFARYPRPASDRPPSVLQELRARRGITQLDVATRLEIRQSSVSKLERREDLSLSTLRRYVEALGGELVVSARFVDGSVELPLGQLDPPLPPLSDPCIAQRR